jgi:C4-dicarboxylate-binding protein DctP
MFGKWLRGSLAVAVVAAVGIGVAGAAESTLKIAYETSDTHIKARTAKVFKEELEKLSKGRIEVQVFPNASLMPSRQEVSGAIQGQVQMILPFVSFYESITPSAGVFTMPTLFRDYDHLDKAVAGAVGKAVYGDLEAKGLKPIAFWHETPTYVFTSKKDVAALDDLKGLKIRIYPSAALENTLKRFGANPTVVPGSEVYLALQNGTVDGAVTTPSFAQSLKLTDSLKYMIKVPLVLGGYIVAVNKEYFDKLPADLRANVLAAAAAATAYNQKAIREEVAASEDAMKKAGVKIIEVSAAERAKFFKAAEPVLDAQPDAMKALINEARKIN